MNYPIDKYISQAKTTFSTLVPIFQEPANGWQLGNVFDTLTDFVFRFPDAEPSKGAVVDAAFQQWGKIGGMCWYDDYGWWGIASTKAFDDQYADIFGSHLKDFQKIATDCWDAMHTGKPDTDNPPYKYKGAPMVWENRDEGNEPGYFTSPATWAVPRFSGGVWQYDLFKDKRTNPKDCTPGSSNPSDPNHCVLGPFQNTVMNGLYFVLALRLALQKQETGTYDAAETEKGFLNAWFSLEENESLLWHNTNNTVLVRERVPTYAYCEERESYPSVKGYHPKGAWCGDQGLIMGGLFDYLKLRGSAFDLPSDPAAQTRAISIARGVLCTPEMVGELGVRPYSPEFDDQNDPDDYSCGSGVFWRYLLRAYNQNRALRTVVHNWVVNNPETNAIYKSAENLFNPLQPSNSNQLFVNFNILATLLAAIEILEAANG
jgi:hypothetical protein